MSEIIGPGQPLNIRPEVPTQAQAIASTQELIRKITNPTWTTTEEVKIPVESTTEPHIHLSPDLRSGQGHKRHT